jgi:hypothetical protein
MDQKQWPLLLDIPHHLSQEETKGALLQTVQNAAPKADLDHHGIGMDDNNRRPKPPRLLRIGSLRFLTHEAWGEAWGSLHCASSC